VPIVAAFLCGWIGLLAGTGVSERELLGAGAAERAYYALGLFVMGGLDLGTPVGGPAWARTMLWISYFGSPLITASALIEAGLRLIVPLATRVRPFRDHVVLGGAGRLSLLYVARLRAEHPRRQLVVVERDSNHPAIGELRDVHRATVVVGDVTNDDVLGRLHLNRAQRALFLTGDDFVNLDAAAKVLRLAPGLAGRIVVHVSNLGFMRETAGSRVARECVIFNGHEAAATNLVREHLLTRFHSTPSRDFVVLAGFGRFGQTVLTQLQEHARGSFGHVLLIDEHATRNARTFEEHPGFDEDYHRTIIDGDLLDPQVWRRVAAAVREADMEPVVILGSGNDGTNLHAAFLARKQHPGAYLIVRSFRASPFTSEIASEANLEAFDLAGLIQDGMPTDWF
jgi:Trk K+ transport system NAD-binding subunit